MEASRAVSPDINAKSSSSSENNDAPEEPEEEPEEPPVTMIGGEIATSAFCLLDGVAYGKHLDPSDSSRITVPITVLPATLGRSHESSDPNFFSLGPKKALSREQCRIYFQEPNGGRFSYSGGKFVYEPHASKEPKRQVIPLHDDEPLPSSGFFAIECLGKNKITVGTHKVEQGQVAQLESGTPIRISTVCLFFLLPTDAKETVLEIPAPKTNKRKRAPGGGEASTTKRASTKGFGLLQQEVENMSSDDLLTEVRDAIDSGTWERRHQLMSGILAYHAVKDASRSKRIRAIVREHGGVQKKQVMDWIATCPKYAFWVKHHLNQVELASYQSTITKVLQKAGYDRLGKHGRYVKWTLPPSAGAESEVSDEELEESDNGDDDSDSASDNDAKPAAVASGKEQEDNSSDDDEEEEDDAEENVASAAESKASKSNNDSDDGSPDEHSDDDDSSDDNEGQGSPKADSPDQEAPSESGDGSDEDNDSDSDPSNDEKALAAASALEGDVEMEDAEESDQEDSGSSLGVGEENGENIMMP